jgi:hypothetical protein
LASATGTRRPPSPSVAAWFDRHRRLLGTQGVGRERGQDALGEQSDRLDNDRVEQLDDRELRADRFVALE